MSRLNRIEPYFGPSRVSASGTTIDPADDVYYQNQTGAGVAQSGALVTADTALRVSAVYACVRIIAQSVAVLPLLLYRLNQDDETRTKATDHALFHLLSRAPNPWQTAIEFRMMMQYHLTLRGNAYALILSAPNGDVIALKPLHPDRVRVFRLPGGLLRYEVRDPVTGATQSFLQDEIMHLRGISSDGILGLSPIAIAREGIGGAIATQDYANRLFQNDARPGGVLTVPGKLSDAAAKRLKEDWQQKFSGQNSHKTAILEKGSTWNATAMTPEDAQFILTRNFQTLDICRIFGVPPHMVGELDRTTHANIENQGIEYVTHTLMPWLVTWEQAISRDLLAGQEADTLEATFQVDALLRGDTPSRYAAYAVGRQWGWLNPNEIRNKEGMDPMSDGGDVYLRPINMTDAALPIHPTPPPAPESAKPLPDPGTQP
jgi:HK97 family phage portal protein